MTTKFPPCSDIWCDFSRCFGARNQFDNFYKYNVYEDCGEIFADWRKCLRASLVSESDIEKVTKLYETTDMFKQKEKKKIKDQDHILHMKKIPSWLPEK